MQKKGVTFLGIWSSKSLGALKLQFSRCISRSVFFKEGTLQRKCLPQQSWKNNSVSLPANSPAYMLPCILHEKVFTLLVSIRARIDDTTLRWSLDLICLRGDWFYPCCANVEQFCREHVAISNNESLPMPSMWQRNRFLECFLRYSWWSPQWLPCEINVRKKLLIDRFSTLARNHFKIVEFWISELSKHHETFRNLKRVPCFGQAQAQQIQQANVSDLPCFRCSSRIPETWPNLEAFTDDGSPANLSSTFNYSAIVL